MPSSVGHALAAVAAGCAVAPPPASRRRRLIQAVIFGLVGASADLDLLFHRHSAETHSIGAAAIVATVAAVLRWPVARTRPRIWLAVAAAYLTHPLLDALAEDSSPPFGIMALWPFSSGYYICRLTIFDSIYRQWHEAGFVSHNLAAIGRELLILAPIAATVWWLRSGSRRATDF
jgi:hypothetical protein